MNRIQTTGPLLLLLIAGACNTAEPPTAPAAAPSPVQQNAPFQGAVQPATPAPAPGPAVAPPSQAPLPVIPAGEPTAAPAVAVPPVPIAANPADPQAPLPVIPGNDMGAPGPGSSTASINRHKWLTEPFRCRAISTVRLRKCRFKETDTGYSLSFQNDVHCSNVEFDANGHPNKLTGCRSRWLRVPSSNTMKQGKGSGNNTWSGSHGGWRWKDGEKYCCPGMWLEGPEGLAL